jgi:hypothetical protein
MSKSEVRTVKSFYSREAINKLGNEEAEMVFDALNSINWEQVGNEIREFCEALDPFRLPAEQVPKFPDYESGGSDDR